MAVVLPVECLTIASLRRQYLALALTPEAVIEGIYERIAADAEPGVFIELAPRAMVMSAARRLGKAATDMPPLWGIPFVVKDNIDVLGFNTTAACPTFAYTPTHNATVVQKLLDAGALVLGKTNLDQFATGLVGTRSPYGLPTNAFNRSYIAGGSSSGSAVAVARGYASFALGTDTAGSGRVPAGFANIVGLKPTKGMLSTKGVVPACASLDCVSVFALTVQDAGCVADVAKGYDALCDDSLLQANEWQASATFAPCRLRVGIPGLPQRSFCDDKLAESNFDNAIELVRGQGAEIVDIDFSKLFACAELLYAGPWVAERLQAAGPNLRSHRSTMDPVVSDILSAASGVRGVDVFAGQRRLRGLRTEVQRVLAGVDILMVPTTPTIFTLAKVAAEPVKRNSDLGLYTNYANLLNLCALAVPAGFRADGLPAGVTFLAQGGRDSLLAAFGARFHSASSNTMGTSGPAVLPVPNACLAKNQEGWASLFVVGAHMSGQPLHQQLASRKAVFLAEAETAPTYKLFSLPSDGVARPALLRVQEGGTSVQGEVWAFPLQELGGFVCGVPAPLCIGRVALRTGEDVMGFTCEAAGLEGASDISEFGSWRRYLARGAR